MIERPLNFEWRSATDETSVCCEASTDPGCLTAESPVLDDQSSMRVDNCSFAAMERQWVAIWLHVEGIAGASAVDTGFPVHDFSLRAK
jgi:hypothetical protein